MESECIWVRPNVDEWRLLQSLSEELGLKLPNLIRLGLRALVRLGVEDTDRYLFKRRHSFLPSSDRWFHLTPTRADWLIIASLREQFGREVPNATICRIAVRALARKEQMACAAMTKQRPEIGAANHSALPVVVVERTPAAAYVSLAPKMCEICSKSFLRVIGDEEKMCSNCEERLATAERLEEASLAAAKRDLPKSDKDRERRESLDPALSRSPAPARTKKKLARSTASQRMTIVRNGRRREAAIANGIRVTA
jgi:hypothetical protein